MSFQGTVIAEGYPLQWPTGWPRTQSPQVARFDTRFTRAVTEMLHELDLLKASDVVISSNLQLRRDGLPYAGQKQPEDRGVAVYFTLRGEQQCIPCDKWNRVEDNIQAVRLTIAALRGLERWGAKEMVDAAFRGFKALPAGSDRDDYLVAEQPWYEVLEVAPSASREVIDAAYKRLLHRYHPDKGGSDQDFMRLQRAYKKAT